MKKLSASIIILLILSLNSWSSQYKSETGWKFLQINSGAKLSAMGTLYCSIADVNNVFGNPAVLPELEKKSISISHNKWLANISEQTLAVALPYKKGYLGLGIKYLHMDEMTGYDIDNLGQPVKISDFTAYDAAFLVSYSETLTSNVSLGFSVKFLQEKIEDEDVSAVAIDLGFHKKLLDRFSVGFAIQNMGFSKDYVEEDLGLPLTFKLGFDYRSSIKNSILAFQLERDIDENTTLSLGQESWLANILAIRYGYSYNETVKELEFLSGINAGVGLKLKGLCFDYAFRPYGDLGNIHKISLSTSF